MRRDDDRPAAVRDVVVIGASAGGVSALRIIASRLPAEFPAAVLVVLHTGAFPSRLPEILSAAGPNRATFAVHGGALHQGTTPLAPPGHPPPGRGRAVRADTGPEEEPPP